MTGIDWIEMRLRLCDDEGMTSNEPVVDNPMPVGGETYLERHGRLKGAPEDAEKHPDGWPCTSHAHYNGPYGPLHITCTSPAHSPEESGLGMLAALEGLLPESPRREEDE